MGAGSSAAASAAISVTSAAAFDDAVSSLPAETKEKLSNALKVCASDDSNAPDNAGLIGICLHKMSGEKPSRFEVKSDATCADLKKLILQSERLPAGCSLSLVFEDGRALDCDSVQPLSDYNVKDGTTLTLIKKKSFKVVTASYDNTAKIWDVTTGECLQTLSDAADIRLTYAAFSMDGSLVLTSSCYEEVANLWSCSTGELLHTLSGHMSGYDGYVHVATFSTDGSFVLTASRDKTAKIWSTASGECTRTLAGHTDEVLYGSISTDDALVVTASMDHTAKIWNAVSGELDQTLFGHSAGVVTAVFCADGSLVATASSDTTAKTFSVSSGDCIQTFSGSSRPLASAIFSSDAASLVTTSTYEVKVWQAASAECVHTLVPPNAFCYGAVFSPDDSLVLAGGQTTGESATIWKLSSGECLHRLQSDPGECMSSPSFSPDGSLVLNVDVEGMTAKIWDASTGELLQTLSGHTDMVTSANFLGAVPGKHFLEAMRDFCDSHCRYLEQFEGD